jgi:hypothetical protein
MASVLPIDSAADRRDGDFGKSPFCRQLSGALTLPDFTGRSSAPNSKAYFLKCCLFALDRLGATIRHLLAMGAKRTSRRHRSSVGDDDRVSAERLGLAANSAPD